MQIFKVKSLVTLATIGTLCYLVIANPNSDIYSTAFIGSVSGVMAYYFNKDNQSSDE